MSITRKYTCLHCEAVVNAEHVLKDEIFTPAGQSTSTRVTAFKCDHCAAWFQVTSRLFPIEGEELQKIELITSLRRIEKLEAALARITNSRLQPAA